MEMALELTKMSFSELTSNQCIEGMKKIFELESFINVERNRDFHINITDDRKDTWEIQSNVMFQAC